MISHDPCLRTNTDVDQWAFLYGDRANDFLFMPYFARYSQDYLIANFTLAELRTLRRKTRYGVDRNPYLHGEFMTLEEVVELALELNHQWPRKDIGQKVGLYIETKMYDYYLTEQKVDIAEKLFQVL